MSSLVSSLFPSPSFFTGGIEGFLALTGVSGGFLDRLGALPPEALVLLDTAHVWVPALTLLAFLFFGPAAFAHRLRARFAGLSAASAANLGTRAWLALTLALAARQIILFFAGLPPVKAALMFVGIEIIPARSLTDAYDSRDAVSGSRSRRASLDGGGASGASGAASRACVAAQFEPLANHPTSFPNAQARVEDVVQPKDYREFKERMAGMPERLPVLETGGEWHEMMHKTRDGMSYRAWRHVLPYGGTEYLSRTVFEDSTVEEMCDFFDDDDVRASWDRLLYRHRVLERDEKTGAQVVFWERALPVISNRDYVFSRRTWKDGETYWAVNKGCAHTGTPETPGLKRVDPYFSSWRMRATLGRDGRISAAECILSHFEEQHVNQDVARFAVKCGMWGVVKNMDAGFRAYQRRRAREAEAISEARRSEAAGRPSSFLLPERGHRAPSPASSRASGAMEALKKIATLGALGAGAAALAAADHHHRVKREGFLGGGGKGAGGRAEGGGRASGRRFGGGARRRRRSRRWSSTSSTRGARRGATATARGRRTRPRRGGGRARARRTDGRRRRGGVT